MFYTIYTKIKYLGNKFDSQRMNGFGNKKKRKLIKIILLSPLQARSKINQHKSLYPICMYCICMRITI